MCYQIIKQPDGKFGLFCRSSDTVAMWNATGPEIVDWFVERAAQDARTAAERVVAQVEGDRAREAYAQFAMTWDEALAADREHGGEAWHDFEEKP